MKKFWKKHSIYELKAYDANDNLICEFETRNAIDCGRMIQMLNSNGYEVVHTPYDEKINLVETFLKSYKVFRNYFITTSFIVSMILCYFKNNKEHTVLKSGIVVWIVMLIGWCISLILDNHYKVDKFTASTSDVLLKFDDALEKEKIDESIKEASTLEIKELFKLTLEQRKTFQKEIAVVLGGIGAILGSATFLKFLGLVP